MAEPPPVSNKFQGNHLISLVQGYGGHTGLGGLSSSLSASTSNLSTASSGTSSSQQGGRRPIIIRDAQQRAMLQNIRDSLAHLQKPNSLPSPGSDHSGASGTSTPNRDGLQNNSGSKETGKRTTVMDNYHEKALNEIRKSLKNFVKNDDPSEVLDPATAKVNVKELIQAICPNDGHQHNGQFQSKFGGLVGTIGPHSGNSTFSMKKPVSERPKPEVLASSQVATITDSAGTASPPPLPPRTRASPPPPLPPRDSQQQNSAQTTAVPAGGAPSRTSSQYPLKSRRDSTTATASPRGQSPSPRTHTLPGLNQSQVGGANNTTTMTSPPSATPPSSIEQLVEQTGLSAEQITKILMEHSVNRNQQSSEAHTHSHAANHPHAVLPDRISPAAYQQQTPPQPPPHPHYNNDVYNNTLNSPSQQSRPAPAVPAADHRTIHNQQQHITVTYHNTATTGGGGGAQMYSNGGGGQPPPPPQYPSHMVNSQQSHVNSGPPPPPYNTQHTPHYHQPSPASSVTSGSSNDYLLVNYAAYPNPTGEYRTPAYGESPSSGSSSPASLQGYTPYNYHHIHPAAAAAGHHHHHHMMPPAPISAREAKQQAIITQSAHSQLVSRPHLQTATAPPNHTQAPPSYISSIHAQVGSPNYRQGMSPKGGGNVHIELRNHRDPHLQVNGHPSFQVTAQNGQPQLNSHQLRLGDQNTASIRFQFNTGGAVVDPSLQLRRKGSLETGSNSPVSRTTNQSPLSMISTASTNSDLIVPDRPPPPYPGNSRQHNNPPPPHPINSIQQPLGAESSEPSEPEQSETESESERRGTTHRCTSPKPKLRPEGEKKDEDRRWTQQRHYSPAAYKFYMEQHVENILKQHRDRVNRRIQLEKEMSKVKLSEEAQNQMRKLLKQKETNHLRLKRAKMNRSMFDVIKKLGIGAFGEVSLVRKRVIDPEEHGGNQLYAMKTLRKVDVIRRNQVAHVKAERDMLAEAELEWVTKLYYSFQDKENLYFIMEYIPGGDLMALLIKKGIFEEPLAMFYIAELVLAIESVHKMGFIHRDIKPDNVLIDKDGHLKLTDFGLCTGFRWTHNSKYYQEDGHMRQDSMDPDNFTDDPCNCPKELPKILEKRRKKEKQRCIAHSLVGTPNYIAPEVLLRSGYTRSCDWWSVGVILYEMVVGSPPFLANTPRDTQYKVINWKETLRIPQDIGLSKPVQDLIMKLCSGPENRLGKNGAEEIKKHSFFNPINFQDLRKQRAPHKPIINYPTDTSNFDEVEEMEPSPYKTDDLRQNGNFPEHAFSEFTYRRFFDDAGGYAWPPNLAENLSNGLMQSLRLSNNNLSGGNHSAAAGSQSDDRTPQNSYHEDEIGGRSTASANSGKATSGAGNPVYV